MAQNDGPPTDGTDSASESPVDEPKPSSAASVIDEFAATEEPPLLPRSEPLRTIFRAIGVAEQIVGSLLLLLILILVLSQVAQRYVPGTWPWTGELARLAMVWATFLMAGYLIAYHPHHITIQIVDYVLRGRGLAVVKLFVNVVILLTTLALIYGSITLIQTDIGQVTPAAEIPLRLVNAVPLVGLLLILLRAILGIVVNDVPALRGVEADTK
jgi:TRAP-type C4-dicarboxylate transport system permease small subunit